MNDKTLKLTIEDVASDFPAFRMALVVLSGISEPEHCPGIEALVGAVEAACAGVGDTAAVGKLPEIQQWRAAYRKFGIKKTHYRNAAEALIRRTVRDGRLPRVLPLVDLYNAISVKYRIPIGADDVTRLVQPLAFRYARDGDSFFDMRGDGEVNVPPKPGEVIYADAEKVLCRRWNWRQDARSGLARETRQAALVLQTLAEDGKQRLTSAARELAVLAEQELGARCRWAIASLRTPVISAGLE
ncbi:MAG: B3/4 domain-containing protein [Sphingomonadales bacterium]